MNIGYGSVSSYDSIRYDLFYDKQNNVAYFNTLIKKYTMKLNNECTISISNGKKIWITLSQEPPSKIIEGTIFDNVTYTIF
jgi:hypothetical protein